MMKKRTQKVQLSLTSKRKRLKVRTTPVKEQTDEQLWPDEVDDSFFSSTKACALIAKEKCEKNQEISKNNSNFQDDSFFNNINLPAGCTEDTNIVDTPVLQFPETEDQALFAHSTTATSIESNLNQTNPAETSSSAKLTDNDSLFTDICWEDDINRNKQNASKNNILDIEDNLFCDVADVGDILENEADQAVQDAENVADIQNTQRFLTDVAFKVPQVPKPQKTAINSSYISVTQLNAFLNCSQYQTHEEKETKITSAQEAIADFSQIHWADSQIFGENVAAAEIYEFPSKGNFYGLPDRVKKLICEHKGIQSLYEWQDECLQLPAIKQRKNLIYALPTSGGKTLVSEILMLREIVCREKNVLFVLPYVSIVQEKVSALSPFAFALDFLVEEYTAGRGACPPVARKRRRSIYIASIEKASVLLDSLIDAGRVNELGLVVIDELHLIGERGRGATLEALLTKILFVNAGIQIVGMSATIGNLTEISQFLKADVYTRGFRPVELREYIKCGNDILEINSQGKTLEEVFTYKRSVDFKYSESVMRVDPDHLAGLVSECAPENCCLIFCPSRKNCENVAALLRKILPKNKFLEHRKTEKQDLLDAITTVCGVLSPVLAKTIPFGIAYHHSGLTTDERKFIETAYRFGVVTVICCTSTLAAGVNLPAKRVIIRAPYVGADFLTLSRYKQMVGRAGRAGFGEAGESILIASAKDNIRVGDMLFSPMDKALSSLGYQNGIGLQNLMLSAIGLDLAACRRDLYRLMNSTLFAVQAAIMSSNIEEMVLEILRAMFQQKVLQLIATERSSDAVDIQTTQNVQEQQQQQNPNRIFIGKSTRFELTTIGKAAYKAGVDYQRAHAIYNELLLAQQHLILSNYVHLLYLVVCFNTQNQGDEMFAADAAILYRIYNTADQNTLALFRLLGLTEAHAIKIAKTLSIEGPLQLRLNRLYKALILVDVLKLMPLHDVSQKYNVARGTLQSLIGQTTSAASSMSRFCEQITEFWCFQPLFQRISIKMDRCCAAELEPLLDLPSVKINRAKQLYTAGYKNIEDIAKARPTQLMNSVQHMSFKTAKEIVAASKLIVMKRLDDLEEATAALKVFMQPSDENY